MCSSDLNASGAAYICPQLYNTGGGQAASLKVLNTLINATKRMGDKVDLILMNVNLYTYYLGLIQAQQRTDLKTFGNFDGFTWNGVTVMMDDNVPNGTSGAGYSQIFALNTDYIALRYNTMKPQFKPFDDPFRQTLDCYTANQIVQLTISNPGRVQGRHANVVDP